MNITTAGDKTSEVTRTTSSKITTDLLRIETIGRVITAMAIKVRVVPGMIQETTNNNILTLKSTETTKEAATRALLISTTRVEVATKVTTEVAQGIRSMMTG